MGGGGGKWASVSLAGCSSSSWPQNLTLFLFQARAGTGPAEADTAGAQWIQQWEFTADSKMLGNVLLSSDHKISTVSVKPADPNTSYIRRAPRHPRLFCCFFLLKNQSEMLALAARWRQEKNAGRLTDRDVDPLTQKLKPESNQNKEVWRTSMLSVILTDLVGFVWLKTHSESELSGLLDYPGTAWRHRWGSRSQETFLGQEDADLFSNSFLHTHTYTRTKGTKTHTDWQLWTEENQGLEMLKYIKPSLKQR